MKGFSLLGVQGGKPAFDGLDAFLNPPSALGYLRLDYFRFGQDIPADVLYSLF